MDDGIVAEVKNEGQMADRPVSLGTPNSQRSNGPFAVLKIMEFRGLSCIDEDDLWSELIGRLGEDTIRRKLSNELTKEDLMKILDDRLRS